MVPPLIVTLELDPASFARLDALRRRHFPPDRNVVPAHVTLFHALPGEEELAVRDDLRDYCSITPPADVLFSGVRFLGKGVAVAVDSPDLVRARKDLAGRWVRWLTPQDRQPYRPHVTVQNKANPVDARALYEQLAAGWEVFAGRAEGLRLWYYRGGFWEAAGEFTFQVTCPPGGRR